MEKRQNIFFSDYVNFCFVFSCLPDLKVWRPPDFPLVFATKKLVTINDGFQSLWYSFVFKQLPILSQYFFLAPVFHKESKSKKCNSTFLRPSFQFQPFEIIDFLIFPVLCFHIKRAKKFGSFFGNTDLIFLGIDVVT